MQISLYNLSTELLIKIFRFLRVNDLCRLRQTCARFNSIIVSSLHLMMKNDLLVTNQLFPNRSRHKLNLCEKIRISHNWKIGRYKEYTHFKDKHKFMPWLVLSPDHLWLSRGRYVSAYKRKSLYHNKLQVNHILNSRYIADISKFVYKQGYLLCGTRDGGVWIWSDEQQQVIHDNSSCHVTDVNSVDLNGQFYVTGSRDNYLKLWLLNKDDLNSGFAAVFDLTDRIWSTAFSESGDKIFVGTAAYTAPPINIIDINTNTVTKLGKHLRKGSGVLDVKWEGPNMIWTCGYDSRLRRWDLRTGKCEQFWEDPHFQTLYCFDYDYFCTALTGCQDYGRVILWDTRKTNYVQMYFMQSCRGKSSPIYSMSFDAKNLFAATDRHLNVLDFSIFRGNSKNYSDLFYKQITVTL